MVSLMFIVIAIALVIASDQSPRDDFNRFLSEHVEKSVTTLNI